MANKFPEPYSLQERQNAIGLLAESVKDGKPAFSQVSKKTDISVPTLKRWWIKYQLERQRELKTKLEEAITSILKRIENLAQETNNLKELAPVVKMLSELLQGFEEDELDNGWS